MGQRNTAGNPGPGESMENAEIPDAFPIFPSVRLAWIPLQSPRLPLCGVTKCQSAYHSALFCGAYGQRKIPPPVLPKGLRSPLIFFRSSVIMMWNIQTGRLKKMASKRKATVDHSICVACGACAKVCPKGAISIWKGCFANVAEETCVGCGLCARVCPAGCIAVRERSEAV